MPKSEQGAGPRQGEREHPRQIKYVFLGHPRGGSAALAAGLQQAGFAVEHEKLGADGMVSWWYTGFARAGGTPGGPVRFRAKPARNYPELLADQVFFYIRDPFAAIPSILVENEHADRANASFRYRANQIQQRFGLDLNGMDPLPAAITSYVCWNQMAEALAGHNPPLHVEAPDLGRLRPDLGIARLPVRNTTVRKFGSPKPDLSPDEIQAAVPAEVKDGFDRYAAMYTDEYALLSVLPRLKQDVFRNVMLYWDDPTPPASVLEVYEAWKAACPGWKVSLFSRPAAAAYLEQKYGTDIKRLFLACRFPAMQSDVFRVLWAIEEGGIYSDISFRPRREPLFFDPGKELTLLWWPHKDRFISGLFYAQRDCAELKKVAFQIVRTLSRRDERSVWYATGPGAWIATLGGVQTATIKIVDRGEVFPHYVQVAKYEASTRGSAAHWDKQEASNSSLYERDAPASQQNQN